MSTASAGPRVELALLGLWHLGSVAAAGWLESHYRVVGWDPDAELRALIRSGETPVVEPGVTQALAEGLLREDLTVADSEDEAVSSARVCHVAYDTQLDDDNRPDDPRLDHAVDAFLRSAPYGALLLVSSQIPVGTCAGWKKRLDEANRGLLIAHAPENLRLGRALDDFLHPERLLIGADDDQAFASAAALFRPLNAVPTRLGLASAEMAKHATNAYLALCIAFANDLAVLSLAAGADPNEVIAALKEDSRVAPSAPLRPGTAFSGATLIRDLTTLSTLGEEAGRPDLFAAVIASNERHAHVAVDWLEDEFGALGGKCIAVAGLTYKPGTSTLRDSLPLRVVTQLVDRGASVRAWDPSAEPFEAPSGLTRFDSLATAVADADALVVLTALPELATADWSNLLPANRLVVDVCSVVDVNAARTAGWSYRGFARA